ncbi:MULTISPECIES: SPFH domain-containing protein [Aerococcus]|uniref:SPFH domain-containing protein n=1 Tax=Aerococcus urinae (strain CCUG 59500 / ACS-120-V-Col10a) TaxID=2976812 RepID=UPI0018C8D0DD|nr:SPFH domain-containing protein [Aerococcus sp. Group 1]MCY3030373.1 SPFH domain-containing protein [Aerococcus sp. Group 1]MCY3061813.1 SPFH domain-containing protein [Aerococcus sp. Group 1]
MTETVLTGKKNGMAVLIAYVIGFILAVILLVADLYPLINALAIAYLALAWLILFGLKVLSPQESLVLTLFGRYIGTLKGEGFYFVNPFSQAINPAAGTYLGQSGDVRKTEKQSADDKNAVQFSIGPSKKISLKAMTLNNSKQKINDYLGNPVEIGIAVIWRVDDTAKAVFNVDNYKEYLSLQTDSALRNIIRQYPYDVNPKFEIDTTGDGEPDDGSLRGSSEIVALRIKEEIQSRVDFAGLEIVEARITHLSYAPEIAAAMLQRQQASALIDARAMIVDGAVGMVEMALDKLEAKQVVDLDEERKAAMVSNLLVVLCGNSEVSPIVNSGSLY